EDSRAARLRARARPECAVGNAGRGGPFVGDRARNIGGPAIRLEGHLRNGLAANTQLLQNRLVTLRIRIAQVSQKPATLGYQGQQTLAGAVVFLVRREMLSEQRNALAQESNLYFWRPGVGFVALIRGKNLPLCFNRQCHSRGNAPCLLLFSFWYVN